MHDNELVAVEDTVILSFVQKNLLRKYMGSVVIRRSSQQTFELLKGKRRLGNLSWRLGNTTDQTVIQ